MTNIYPWNKVYRVQREDRCYNYYPPSHFMGSEKDWEMHSTQEKYNLMVERFLSDPIVIQEEDNEYWCAYYKTL